MSQTPRPNILVVEDSEDLARALVENLTLEGYQVQAVADGHQALSTMVDSAPDLVLLDVMLPGTDGYSVLRAARKQGYAGLVLMLTARGTESDKVRGLRGGADDYVTKPFGLMELLARVDALLRRAPGALSSADSYSFGTVRVETATRRVFLRNSKIGLTPRELDLLLALLQRQGAVVSREQLLREVWGHSGLVESRTVDTHIAELRRKLERDPARPAHILTVRKAGYRLQR